MTYYEWLVHLLSDDAHPYQAYSRTMSCMMNTEFYWVNPYDRNRMSDGLYLRGDYEREAEREGDEVVIDAPPYATVLEVLAALAIRCENQIMYDPDEGDRTAMWFWMMVRNLGMDMPNYQFNEDEANAILGIFLDVAYEPNGEGGLFPVKNSHYDMREMDIWQQMSFYLNRMFPM